MTQPFIYKISGLQHKSFYDEKAKKTRYFVAGYSTTGDLDLQNEIITAKAREDVDAQAESRVFKLDYDHETLRSREGADESEKVLNMATSPLGKAVQKRLDALGNWFNWELNPNWKQINAKGDIIKTFGEVWEEITDGFLDAFSVAFYPIERSEGVRNGKNVSFLEKFNIRNIALTGNPINPGATMTNVMAKSLHWLEKQKGDVTMTKDEKKSDEVIAELKSKMAESEEKVEKLSKENAELKSKIDKEKADAKVDAEKKSVETLTELKSSMEKLDERVEKLAKENTELKSIVEKARPAGHGASDPSKTAEAKAAAEAEGKGGPLDTL